MVQREYQIISDLQICLKSNYPHWQIHNVREIGKGLEALVLRADSSEFGEVAIKVPWKRWIENENDNGLDARDFLRQEVSLATHLHQYGVPVPKIHALHTGDDDFDFLLSSFVDHDQTPFEYAHFGEVVRAIHESPLFDLSLAAQTDASLNRTLAERLVQRSQAFERLTDIELNLPHVDGVHQYLFWPEARQSILHMDARPTNFLTRNGQVVAVIDWSNALVGDPALELARIAECGHSNMQFVKGYGENDGFSHVPRHIDLLYHLDTAIMLAIVFLSEAPNPQSAKKQVHRTIYLLDQFAEEINTN